jgi:hypothetical protein
LRGVPDAAIVGRMSREAILILSLLLRSLLLGLLLRPAR